MGDLVVKVACVDRLIVVGNCACVVVVVVVVDDVVVNSFALMVYKD